MDSSKRQRKNSRGSSLKWKSLSKPEQVLLKIWVFFFPSIDNVNSTLLPDYERTIYAEYLPEEDKKDPQLIFVNNQKVQ